MLKSLKKGLSFKGSKKPEAPVVTGATAAVAAEASAATEAAEAAPEVAGGEAAAATSASASAAEEPPVLDTKRSFSTTTPAPAAAPASRTNSLKAANPASRQGSVQPMSPMDSPTTSAAGSPTWQEHATPVVGSSIPELKVERVAAKPNNSFLLVVLFAMLAFVCLNDPSVGKLVRKHLPPNVASMLLKPVPPPKVGKAGKIEFSGNLYGMAMSKTFAGTQMTLRSTDMRKKFIVNVYTVGLYTTDDKLSQLKKLTTSADRAKSLSGNGVALLLTFQREVDNASLRGAFLAALGEGGVSYNRDRDTLLAALTTPFSPTGTFAAKTVSATSTASSTSGAVPQAKYQKADTIEFTYQGASKLTVVINGKHIKSIDSGATSSALRSKLMEVYVGKEAVTPELLPSLETLLV